MLHVYSIHYQLHKKGQTEQARSDLARLAEVRKQREEEAAKKKAEAEGTSHPLRRRSYKYHHDTKILHS